MARFRKSIRGDENQQNEVASHNRIVVETGGSVHLLTVFFCILIAGSIIFMAVVHWALLQALLVTSFVGAFVLAWIVALSLTARHVSTTKAQVAIDQATQNRALIEADVIYASEHYILYRDPDGEYQFRGTVHVDEHRQFLPREISTPSHQETILELWDKGMSGRGIEKMLKEKKVSYREIIKTLDLYRPGWNTTKKVVDGEIVSDSDETPV